MNYTIHQIRRTKQLNEKYYEVLFQRDNLKTPPGTQITLLDGSQYLVASGVLEAWCRLIVDETRVSRSIWGKTLKVKQCDCLFPDLLDNKKPSFIAEGESIAVPLSYISTFPDRKIEIVYKDSHPIHYEWLKVRTTLTEQVDGKSYYEVLRG